MAKTSNNVTGLSLRTKRSDVGDARTPNDANPVDEEAILKFVQDSDAAHAQYVRSAFHRVEELDQAD